MNRKRRRVLNSIAVVLGATVGTTTGPTVRATAQQVDTLLLAGVTLFDLNRDGNFTVSVEQASAAMRDDEHPRPIHVTSHGRTTLDYATSIVQLDQPVTVGDLNRLAYDYYEGQNNVNPDEKGGANAPDEAFLAVENTDGKHGMYLTYNDDEGDGSPGQQWRTHDIAARVRGNTTGTSGWFEFTNIEEGYDGQRFDDVVARFGADARVVRVGIGRGNAVNPSTLDLFYDTLVINDRAKRFPVSVVKRASNVSPL